MSHTDSYTVSVKRRLVTGTAWALGGRVLALLMSLAVNVLLARMLKPADLGLYFLVFSLASAGALMAQLGLNRSVVRLIATSLARSQPGVAAQRALAVLWLGVVGAIVTGVILLGVGDSIIELMTWPSTLVEFLGWASVWTAALAMVTLQAEVFRGYHDIRSATLFGGLATNSCLVIVLAVLWSTRVTEFSIGVAVQVAALVTTVVAVIGLWKLRDRLSRVQPTWLNVIPRVLRESWPLFLGSMAAFVLTQVDLWIVGKYRPQEEVALYGAAARLVLLVTTPLVIANAVIPPLIAELYTLGRVAQLQHVVRLIGAVTSVPMLLALSVLIAMAAPVLGLVYGDFYRDGASLLVVLSFGAVALSLVGSAGMVLTMTGHQMTILFITVTSGGLVVFLALWLVQTAGAEGVATATAIGSTAQFAALWVAARIRVGIWTHAGFLRWRHLREAWRLFRRPSRASEGEGV